MPVAFIVTPHTLFNGGQGIATCANCMPDARFAREQCAEYPVKFRGINPLMLNRHKSDASPAFAAARRSGELAAMVNPKKDLDVLADFLTRESERYELYRDVLDAIHRIGSLAGAENEARQALEIAQIDLAWAQTELDRVEAAVNPAKEAAQREIEEFRLTMEAERALIRRQYEEERAHLEAVMAERRAALSKLTRRLSDAQKAASLLADALRGPDLASGG